jgi:hypothetical protein
MDMIKVTKQWERHSNASMWDDMCEWCARSFGPYGKRWRSHATLGYMDFEFEHEADASLFIMKWM